MTIFGTKEEVLARLDGFRRFNEWEERHPVELTPQESLAIADELYSMLSDEARMRNDDPEYHGVRAMTAWLSRLT